MGQSDTCFVAGVHSTSIKLLKRSLGPLEFCETLFLATTNTPLAQEAACMKRIGRLAWTRVMIRQAGEKIMRQAGEQGTGDS
jgi:hypothetical protein